MNATVENKTARTFLLEPVQYRIDGAARYGPLHYIFPPDAARSSIWETSRLSDEILQRLDRLQYDPNLDYLVVTGHQIALATMIAVVANDYGNFRALFYDMNSREYVERVLG